MSTKIYDAYRIKQSEVNDIFDLLNEWRDKASEFIKNSEQTLKKIHVGCLYWLTFNTDKDKLEKKLKRFNEDPMWEIQNYLKESENSSTYDLVYTSIRLRVSIFKDDDYWYFKFFPCEGWSYRFLTSLEKEYPELEDYHYQNQTDPPEDMPYEEYKARDDKWEELGRYRNDYKAGMMFDVMDADEFYKIVSEYYYTGEKNLYKHLAYDFDKKLLEKKDEKLVKKDEVEI